MLKFGVDAAFALGLVGENVVHVSARGGKKVNVGIIMGAMEGQCGGSSQSAGGRIYTDDVFKVENELLEKINLGISSEEDIIEEPPIIKKKQVKRQTNK
jgi:c-di-AMP phosphodiesterase-like protein